MRPLLPISLAVFFASCGGSTQRTAAPSDEPARLACDRLAARSIQVAEPGQAATLAAQAAACYRSLETGDE